MTVALVANIARPISSAISTAFSADSYGLLSSYGLIGASANPDAVIEALFANSEVGAWYDPSDLSTMFQDSAGTTPVTADGQTVGLILDKSKGLVLGPELVTNGGFDTNNSGWALTGGTYSITDGVITFTNVTTRCVNTQQISTVPGTKYRITVVGNANPQNGGVRTVRYHLSSNEFPSASSAFGNSGGTVWFTATNTTTWVYVAEATATIGAIISIDDISVKPDAGNHASQTTAARRPLYKTDGTYHWLQFDGVDDSLSTAAINFTSTDKMSWFHGTKINNTSFGLVVELSAVANSNIGSFNSYFNDAGTGGLVGRAYKNSVTGPAEVSVTVPNTSVYSLKTDFAVLIGGQAVSVRRNGSAYSVGGTHTAGSVTFGTYPLYIGQRGGTSLPLNGNIYSLIVRGALSTTQEITDTETWVNSKCGAY